MLPNSLTAFGKPALRSLWRTIRGWLLATHVVPKYIHRVPLPTGCMRFVAFSEKALIRGIGFSGLRHSLETYALVCP